MRILLPLASACALAIELSALAGEPAAPVFDEEHARSGPAFLETVARIEADRRALFEKWSTANAEGRAAVRDEARDYFVGAITREIFPEWMGTPWTMAGMQEGLRPDASVPGERGHGVSCSWFVVSALRNAGLRFAGPSRFAGTIAVHLEHSVAPGQIKRFWNTTPDQLERKLVALGPGLWVIGLNCHIGFVHVTSDHAWFVHSSYVEPYAVVREAVSTSEAIALSEDRGYVLAPLFRDRRLVEHWLSGRPVPFEELPKTVKAKR